MALDFFDYITEIRRFAPQIKSDAKLDNFNPFLRPTKQRITNSISQAAYDAILTYWAANKTEETTTLGKAALYLRAALANFVAIPYFKFEAGERNGTDRNLYPYQERQQIEIYLDNVWAEFDQLLTHMDANIADFAGYAATDRYKIREKMYLKSPAAFNRYFNISNSAYFFNSSILLQEEIINDQVKSRIPDYPTVPEIAQWPLGKAVAYRTIAAACQQLDYTELPQGIRNDFTKAGTDKKLTEIEIKETLAVRYNNKADEYFLEVEHELNEARNDGTYTIPEDTLTEDDQFFMPS